MISFSFEDTQFERPAVLFDYDLELGVIADFAVYVDGRLLYSEVMFPIVELRVALEKWARYGPDAPDFEFASMEADETGLIWLRRQEDDRWRIGSIHQELPAFEVYEWPQLKEAIDRYATEVDDWVYQHLRLKVTDVTSL